MQGFQVDEGLLRAFEADSLTAPYMHGTGGGRTGGAKFASDEL